jgi:small-conductance mechanosensitive channel
VAIAGSIMAAISDIASSGHFSLDMFDGKSPGAVALFLVGIALVVVGGIVAARFLGTALGHATGSSGTEATRAPLARLVTVVGYVFVVLWAFSIVGITLQVLLLGGALSGIILGIAAQQTIGNIFAGIVLLIVRPFQVGRHAIIKSSLGEYEGLVTDMGFFYVRIQTARGRVELPNAVALASAVGPGARSGDDASDSGPEEELDRTSAEQPVDRPDRPEAP